MIDTEIGKGGIVMAPREEERKHGGSQKCPLQRPTHEEEAKDKEETNESANINRANGEGLVAPILI